ncbi:MAG TPA: murein biosynthesis integral membrane protein MurJ [Streptosporangiaceae bacterium]
MSTVARNPVRKLAQSSAIMALGTVASRITGFVRTAVIVYALGTGAVGDAFNTSNTLPNSIHDLVLGGTMTSVVLPMLVRANKRDSDDGMAYTQRLYTLLVIGLLAVTAVAMILAGPIVDMYIGDVSPAQRHLAILFALFFFPQIFFYGVNAYQSAVLNTRDRFGAPMWTPVINNVVIIAVGLAFMVITHGHMVTADSITPFEIQLLGIGTTGAIVLQTLALMPSMRAVGFRWRPRFDFRKLGLAEMGRMASWTFLYVVVTQAGFLVATRFANSAGEQAREAGLHYGAGLTPYANAYQMFQLPYAIIAVSVITALLPRMSRNAADAQYDLVRDDFSNGLRVSAVLLVPASFGMLVFGEPAGALLFGHGNASSADGAFLGYVIQAFALGLVPFAAFQLLLRVFYAMKDTRTPALISFVNIGIGIGLNVTSSLLLPPNLIVPGLAVGYWVPYIIGSLIAWRVLSRRIGGLDGRRVATTIGRLFIAGIPALIFGYAMTLGFNEVLGRGAVTSVLILVVGGGIGMLLYVLFARKVGAGEVSTLIGMVRAKLPGRRA